MGRQSIAGSMAGVAALLGMGMALAAPGAPDPPTIPCAAGQTTWLSGAGPARMPLLVYWQGRAVGGGSVDAAGRFAIPLRVGRERPGVYRVDVRSRASRALLGAWECAVGVAVPTQAPSATPIVAKPTQERTPRPLPPPSFNNCQADPNAAAAPNEPVRIAAIDKAGEIVRLRNVSAAAISLDGWNMCSITANQLHVGIGGSLGPGETKDFGHTNPGNIWNNSERDDGALYNAAGQLVSYWADQ